MKSSVTGEPLPIIKAGPATRPYLHAVSAWALALLGVRMMIAAAAPRFSGLTLVMRWIDGLKSYQFVQTDPNSVTVRLDRGSGFGLSEAEVVEFLRKRIAEDVRWNVVWGAPELTVNGKALIIRNDWLRNQGLQRPR